MRECLICHACGCGTALYEKNGQLYCITHLPKITTSAQAIVKDDQVLTTQQKINLGYSG